MTPKKAFLVMIGIVAGVILLGATGYYFGDQQLVVRSEEISDLQADLEAVNQKISIFEDSRSKVEEFGFIEDLSNKVLPADKSQSELIAEIKNFARQNGMAIQTINFTGGDAAIEDPRLTQTSALPDLDGVRVLSVQIGFATDPKIPYNNFLNFLKRVEQNQRKMQVTEVSVTPDQADPSTLSGASVNINVFTKLN